MPKFGKQAISQDRKPITTQEEWAKFKGMLKLAAGKPQNERITS